MKVICIRERFDLTKNKIYEVITKIPSIYGSIIYTIIDDSGEICDRSADNFISLSLYRRRKIREINESNLYK